MIIADFEPFQGEHCETTVAGCLLRQKGIRLSEPMLFGLGQGLDFFYWDTKSLDFPFVGGRIKQGLLTSNLAEALGLTVEYRETSSLNRAWLNVKENIDQGKAVGLKLDCYYLDHFTTKFHFAAHYVTMYGYDDQYAYLVDTGQQGQSVNTRLEHLTLARNAKGPMSSRNLSYSFYGECTARDLRDTIITAVHKNAENYLNPPIANLGYKGVLKASKAVRKWFERSSNPEKDLTFTASLMQRGGTGGSLFRNFYRDFLQESSEIVERKELRTAYEAFKEIAVKWEEVSTQINNAGLTGNIEHLYSASALMKELSDEEKRVMELLFHMDDPATDSR